MARHYSKLGREEYAGREASKRQMKMDSGMIHEDRSAPCLLPQGVIEKYWPAGGYHIGYAPQDLFGGAQVQMKEDGADLRRENKPKKY